MFLYNKLTDAYEAEYDIKLNWSATTTASCFPYVLFVKMLWLADHRLLFLLAFYKNVQLLQRKCHMSKLSNCKGYDLIRGAQ